jgi:general secretion pathway protein G
MELMIAVAIIGILGGIAVPGYLAYLDKARIARTIAEIRHIEKSIKLAYATTDRYPGSLAEVSADKILDPWGTPYQYYNPNAGLAAESITRDQVFAAWTWFSPATAHATPANQGQGNGGNKDNRGSEKSRGGNSQNAGRRNPGDAANDANSNGSGSPQSSGGSRKDRFGVSLNTDFDLYSMGKDRSSTDSLATPSSYDDILRANDGAFVGLASDF